MILQTPKTRPGSVRLAQKNHFDRDLVKYQKGHFGRDLRSSPIFKKYMFKV